MVVDMPTAAAAKSDVIDVARPTIERIIWWRNSPERAAQDRHQATAAGL
jgi:hypothetical protein